MVKIKVLMLRNKYYKDNPILKKETFSTDDEVAIEKFLKRIKHPLLLKCKKPFVCLPGDKPYFTFIPRKVIESTENYTNFASATSQETQNFFD